MRDRGPWFCSVNLAMLGERPWASAFKEYGGQLPKLLGSCQPMHFRLGFPAAHRFLRWGLTSDWSPDLVRSPKRMSSVLQAEPPLPAHTSVLSDAELGTSPAFLFSSLSLARLCG